MPTTKTKATEAQVSQVAHSDPTPHSTQARPSSLDLATLWDFQDPALSEHRFRDALAKVAHPDDALILHTQIARTFGLRRRFEDARDALKALEPALATAGDEARVRHALEWGRTFASATHTASEVTMGAQATARDAYLLALATARGAKLDALSIDAIHMLAWVDRSPSDQLKWGLEALAVSLQSTQPVAQRWEASIRNNVGHALHQLGRYDEALLQFEQALALRKQQASAAAVRVAQWMVAWTLRSLNRVDEALVIQRRLAQENEDAGTPDVHVFEELEALHRAQGDATKADAAAKQALALKRARGP